MVRQRKRLFAAAAAAALVLAACGGDDDGDADPPPTTEAPDEPDATDPPAPDDPDDPDTTDPPATTEAPPTTDPPAPVGEWDPDAEFTLSWTIGARGFDPHVAVPHSVVYAFLAPVYDRLMMIDVDGNVQPMLATSWEFSDDGSTLTLVLREGITFHDGEPFDAEAVVANLERAKNHPESTESAFDLEPVTAMEVVDQYTVRLTVTEDAAFLPQKLAMNTGMMVSPAAFDTELMQNPVGAGPYVLESWEEATSVYVRAPGEYWDPEAQKVARFTLEGILDDTARVNALQTGAVDIVNVRGDARAQALQVAASDDYEFVVYPSTTGYGLSFYFDDPTLRDVRIRQALRHAVDVDSIVEDFLEGNCTKTNQPFLPGWAGYDASRVDAYPYDPDRARDLLADAGVTNLQLTMLTHTVEPMATIAVIVQEFFAQVGVTLEIVPLETSELVERWRAGEAHMRTTLGSSLPDPGLSLDRRLNPLQNPGDLSAYSPRLVELLDDLESTRVVGADREAMYQEIGDELVEHAVDFPICFANAEILASERFVGLDNIPFANMSIFDVRFLGIRAD